MAEREQASLAEILAAAREGGIPVVIGGSKVHSIEEVPEEIRDLPTDNEAHVAPGETLPEWLGDRDVYYVIGEEHQPLSRGILGDHDVYYDERGKPITPSPQTTGGSLDD